MGLLEIMMEPNIYLEKYGARYLIGLKSGTTYVIS